MSRILVLSVILLLAAAAMGGCARQTAANPLFPDPYQAGGTTANIIFTDLSASCTIEIITVSGDLVRTIVESDGDGQAVWDVKNAAGDSLAGGVYFYIIKSSDGEKKGRLIITK